MGQVSCHPLTSRGVCTSESSQFTHPVLPHTCSPWHIRSPDKESDPPLPWDIPHAEEAVWQSSELPPWPIFPVWAASLSGRNKEIAQITSYMPRAAPIWRAPWSTLMYTYTSNSKMEKSFPFWLHTTYPLKFFTPCPPAPWPSFLHVSISWCWRQILALPVTGISHSR